MIANKSITVEQQVSQGIGNIVSDMAGEKVMLSIQNGKYYNLGEMGGVIWDFMEKPIVIKEMVSSLVSMYDVNQIECEEQVISFLKHLNDEGLIQLNKEG